MQDFLEEEPMELTDRSIGEFLISILTGGLYVEPHLILREYIQNAHDAMIMWEGAIQPTGRIDIKISPPNIHIYDNGPGMSRDELREAMSKIGVSSKPFGVTTGFMGIGKLAGLSLASKVQIDTSKYGIPERNRVTFYAHDMIAAIERRRQHGESRPLIETLKHHCTFNKGQIPEDPEAHYTAVHLLGINEDHWKVINQRDEFIKKVGIVAPVRPAPGFKYSVKREKSTMGDDPFDFACAITSILEEIAPDHYFPIDIFIDGTPLYRPWCHDMLPPRQIEVLDDDGNRIAFGWACQHNKSEQVPDSLLQGLALLQRGIAVGERRLAEDLGLYGIPPSIYFRWFMGEIYILDREVLLTANRMSLRHNPRALDFLKRVEAELKKLRIAATKFSERDNAAQKAPQDIQEIRTFERRVTDKTMSSEAMPSALRKLVKARDDLKKRSRHLAEDDQEVANQVVQTADTLIQQFTSSVRFDRPANDLRGNITTEESTELTSSESIDTDDITISEEEELQIISISDRFGFTERERRIFHLIIDAVALASGGRDTDTFARYLQQIETSLEREFQTSQKE